MVEYSDTPHTIASRYTAPASAQKHITSHSPTRPRASYGVSFESVSHLISIALFIRGWTDRRVVYYFQFNFPELFLFNFSVLRNWIVWRAI